jgi:hypothetical protein
VKQAAEQYSEAEWAAAGHACALARGGKPKVWWEACFGRISEDYMGTVRYNPNVVEEMMLLCCWGWERSGTSMRPLLNSG